MAMDIYINLNYRGTPFVFYTVHRVEIFFFGAHPPVFGHGFAAMTKRRNVQRRR